MCREFPQPGDLAIWTTTNGREHTVRILEALPARFPGPVHDRSNDSPEVVGVDTWPGLADAGRWFKIEFLPPERGSDFCCNV